MGTSAIASGDSYGASGSATNIDGATIINSTLGNADATQANARFTTPVATTITTSTVLDASHWGKRIIFNSAGAITITFPQQSTLATVAGVWGEFENIGAGDVTFAVQGAESFTNGSNTLVAQGASGKFFRDTTTSWQVMGGTSTIIFEFLLEKQTPANTTYYGPLMKFSGSVTSLNGICNSGTINVAINFNGGTSMGNTVVSSSGVTAPISSNNSFVSGDRFTWVTTSNSSCADL